ncbi:hypothetical protein [Arthrobacter pityocampae]|uniref:hypothetical protein n=1 Tax=Arthrobacter pityocampae TaxID=547334 RepID=UPI003736658B
MDERQRLEPLLRSGETLHWTGRPDPKVLFSPADLFLVPFSLLWGGFALFWEYQVITGGAQPVFILFGIPFVLMGLYMIIGRFIYKSRRKRSTVYGLTESRAIVSSGDRSYKDTPIHGVAVSTKHARNNTHATVTFGSTRYTMYQNTGMGILGAGHDQGIGFFDVPDPDTLTRTLNALR